MVGPVGINVGEAVAAKLGVLTQLGCPKESTPAGSHSPLALSLASKDPVLSALLTLQHYLLSIEKQQPLLGTSSATMQWLNSLTPKDHTFVVAALLNISPVASLTQLGFSAVQVKQRMQQYSEQLATLLTGEFNLNPEDKTKLHGLLAHGGVRFLCEAIPWANWCNVWMEDSRYIQEPPPLMMDNHVKRGHLCDMLGLDASYSELLPRYANYHKIKLDCIRPYRNGMFLGVKASSSDGNDDGFFIALAVDPRYATHTGQTVAGMIRSHSCYNPLQRPEVLDTFSRSQRNHLIRLKQKSQAQLPANVSFSPLALEPGELLKLIAGVQCNPEIALLPRSISAQPKSGCRMVSVFGTLVENGKVALPTALGKILSNEGTETAQVHLPDKWEQLLSKNGTLFGGSLSVVALPTHSNVLPTLFVKLHLVVRNNELQIVHEAAGAYADSRTAFARFKLRERVDLSRLQPKSAQPVVIAAQIKRRTVHDADHQHLEKFCYAKVSVFDHDLFLSKEAVPEKLSSCRVAVLPWPSQKRMIFVVYHPGAISESPFVEAFDMGGPKGTRKQPQRRKLSPVQWAAIKSEIVTQYPTWLSYLDR